MPWILDTNILSELRRPRPEPAVVSFIAGQSIAELYVSVVTLAELRFGIELVSDPAKRSELIDWLDHAVRPMFADRVLPLDEAVLLKWRVLVEEGRKSGHNFSQPDLLIAATASCCGFTVVTRDRTHFEKARVPVFNPWGAA